MQFILFAIMMNKVREKWKKQLQQLSDKRALSLHLGDL